MVPNQHGKAIVGAWAEVHQAAQAVNRAVESWKKAPLTVRMMGGDFAEPLLSAMMRQQEAIAQLAAQNAAIIAAIEGGE